MQIARVQARNQFSVAQVEAIMATQVQRSERLAAADDVIVNEGPPEAAAAAVERLHRAYLDLAAKKQARGL
jgi:dephospho-CoA kinase